MRQKLLSLTDSFTIKDAAGGDAFRVKGKILSFGDKLSFQDDFLDHEYVVSRGDLPVATVSKKWFSFADTYGIEIDDKEDQILILATAVIIDMACHRHRKN